MIETQRHTELVTLPVLARKLRISAGWIKAETDAGRLPHLRAGRRVLYAVEAVKRSLAERAAKGVER